jgi:hypothetical protein
VVNAAPTLYASAMPSKGLTPAVERLVAVATGDGDDKALRAAVNAVVKAFDATDTKATRVAIAKIAEGVKHADGRAAQVLHLTLGALVESGAAPELAWPVVSAGLPDLLASATRFAQACLDRADPTAKSTDVDEALAAAAAEVAQRRPRDAAAWREIPARCLASVACLTRARKLRKRVRAEGTILEAAAPLAEAVDEVGLLVQVLRMIDDETIVVVHPETERAFRVELRDVASNAELLVLLADALGGDGKNRIGVKRPDPRAVAALAAGKAKKTKLGVTFDHDVHDVPDDLPMHEGERIVVLRNLPSPEVLEVETSFPALAPVVRVKEVLPPREAASWVEAARGRRRRRAAKRR